MIINLWSTPRTGSVWYSYKLLFDYKKANPNTILMTEPFNKWHFNIYRKIENGVIKNFHEYSDGLYYDDYELSDDGSIVANRKFEQRVRSISQEEEHRKKLLNTYNADRCTLILHNHTSPLPIGIYDTLKRRGKRNIYIYRADFIQQLSSYAVALATKRFAKFRNIIDPEFSNLEAPTSSLKELTERILFWESLDKSECEVIKYEDIDFSLDNPNNIPVPHRQNITSSFEKLSVNTQKIILDLKSYYDTQHNINEFKV
jgi:hypothetical protein